MLKSENIADLAAALSKAQKEFGVIKRTEHVGFEGKSGGRQYNYAPLDVVIDACREALSKNGLAVLQLTTPVGEDVLRVETVLTHSTGQWISSAMDIRAALDKPQDQGSAMTYARRYSLAAILNVASEEDDDAEGAQKRGEGKQTDKKPEAPRTGNTTPPEHFCKVHNVPFDRHEKDGKVWYSHKDGDKWHNEPTADEVEKELRDPVLPELITAEQIEVVKGLAQKVPISTISKEIWPELKQGVTLQSLPKMPYKSAIILITKMREKAAGIANA